VTQTVARATTEENPIGAGVAVLVAAAAGARDAPTDSTAATPTPPLIVFLFFARRFHRKN